MGIDFSKMTDKKKKEVYAKIDCTFIDSNLIRRTYHPITNRDSYNSFMLSETKEPNKPDTADYTGKRELLKKIFKITDTSAFDAAYQQATSGNGQEGTRISVMHSSALCALLCFYRVSEENPIIINGVDYDKVHFEVQNDVFNTPSNIDIALLSSKEKNILFLESKFSEYLSSGKYKCSIKYKRKYDTLRLKDIGYDYREDDDKGKIILSKGKNEFYIEGIKQMLSHYIGVERFCELKHTKNEELTLPVGYKVLLGEILFNAWSNQYSSFKNYSEEYKELAKHLNKQNNCFFMLENTLTYQDVFINYPLEPRIKKYYRLQFLTRESIEPL
ncbi:MAG TPA: hypothetical protein PLZ06_02080 [Clostridia bacterium]|jgi:hypothetical protein|nr:hypothetical protein [Clostridia bacterium]HQC67939.1 hypothetical protein [Clostridia bacterium]